MLLNGGIYNHTTIIDSITLNNMLFPFSSIPAKEGFKPGYGSGFSTFFVNGHRFFGHGGGLPDFNSIFLFHPESEVGIVVLINKNSDYFWRIVRNVVSSLQLNEESSETIQNYATRKFEPDEIIGYYTQVDYGISLDRFPNYFLSGQKVFLQNDTLFIKEFQSEKQAFINVNGNAYKKIDEAFESIYFFKNSEGELMLTVSGKSFYHKDAAWKPIFHRIFLVFSIFMFIIFLLFATIWLIRTLILRLRKGEHHKNSLLPRLFPMFTILSLIICLLALSIWFGDYQNTGNITVMSLSVFIFSILFPLLSVISFWSCCFKKRTPIKNKIERIYLITVSITLIGFSIFLYHYEIIGLRLWAY